MASVEIIDKHNVKVTFLADAEEFEKGLHYSYNKNKNSFNIQGFRKGKAPRGIIEKQYGENIFFEDAVNYILPDAYEKAVKELKLTPVAKPSIELVSVSKEDGAEFEAKVMVVGEAEVDGYYALTYEKIETEPTEQDIQRRIDIDRDKNARIITVVRPVQIGDIVTIDFNGVIDDEPFEGGHMENYRLTIGAHIFIDTFEEQLIGAETGDNIFVRVTFPDNYDKTELAGKLAVFDVKIKEIQEKELPDMDDDFAQDVSEFDTFNEYREDIVNKLRDNNEQNAVLDKENRIMSQLISKTIVDLPPVMIENRIGEMIRNFENQLKYQGMTLDTFLQYSGQTKEELRESYRDSAVGYLKANLALRAVAKKEGLMPSAEETNAEIDRLAAIYGWDDKQKATIDPDLTAEDLATKRAYDFILEQSIEIS